MTDKRTQTRPPPATPPDPAHPPAPLASDRPLPPTEPAEVLGRHKNDGQKDHKGAR